MSNLVLVFIISALLGAGLCFALIKLFKKLKIGQTILHYVSEHSHKSIRQHKDNAVRGAICPCKHKSVDTVEENSKAHAGKVGRQEIPHIIRIVSSNKQGDETTPITNREGH